MHDRVQALPFAHGPVILYSRRDLEEVASITKDYQLRGTPARDVLNVGQL